MLLKHVFLEGVLAVFSSFPQWYYKTAEELISKV